MAESPENNPAEESGNLEGGTETGEPEKGEEPESFTDVALDDVDSLTPEQIMERHKAMQADYTRKTQALAVEREQTGRLQQDSDALNLLMSYPEIRDVANRIADGKQLSEPQVTPEPVPDKTDDPWGAMEGLVAKQVQAAIAPLMDRLGNVTGFMANQQRDIEYDNLCVKYPAAKTISKERLNARRAQKGGQNSLEETFLIEAGGNPAMFTTSQTPPRKKSPSVEQPVQRSGETSRPVPPKGVRGIQADVAAHQKAGTLGIQATLDRVREKFGL